ncbi:hypothetical protein HOK51_07310 [Candidatus Woesearchaeota archaeon]|mgnify:CR=1 FL=1|jgi:hypothetical protein|nr:hypothetical protein [Candidatus Woesearchaeota archaeon]MBT6519630.1 hypothetical protein [Candidatus Woesearchaeota archaeon]MBT7367545.1 hypothetical protein [Candidatus Woesearchaeota archaeon]
MPDQQQGMPPGMQPGQGNMQQNQQPQKKGGFSLFGGAKSNPAAAQAPQINVGAELNNLSRRLVTIEERYTNLRKKTQVTDQNMLTNNKKIITEIAAANEELKEFKRELEEIVSKMRIMVRELKDCAKRNEVQSLAKYVDLWNPIEFVTRGTVIKMVRDEVSDQFRDLNIKMQEEEFIKEQIKIAMKEYSESVGDKK